MTFLEACEQARLQSLKDKDVEYFVEWVEANDYDVGIIPEGYGGQIYYLDGKKYRTQDDDYDYHEDDFDFLDEE